MVARPIKEKTSGLEFAGGVRSMPRAGRKLQCREFSLRVRNFGHAGCRLWRVSLRHIRRKRMARGGRISDHVGGRSVLRLEYERLMEVRWRVALYCPIPNRQMWD